MKSEFQGINPRTHEKIIIRLENAAVWTFKHEGTVYEVLFSYKRGKISVSGTDDFVMEKMKKIAAGLSCRVVGDEGEEY